MPNEIGVPDRLVLVVESPSSSSPRGGLRSREVDGVLPRPARRVREQARQAGSPGDGGPCSRRRRGTRPERDLRLKVNCSASISCSALAADRKSTRLNSSHANISYAV